MKSGMTDKIKQKTYLEEVMLNPFRESFAVMSTPVLYKVMKVSFNFINAKFIFDINAAYDNNNAYHKLSYTFLETLLGIIFCNEFGVTIKNSARELYDHLSDSYSAITKDLWDSRDHIGLFDTYKSCISSPTYVPECIPLHTLQIIVIADKNESTSTYERTSASAKENKKADASTFEFISPDTILYKDSNSNYKDFSHNIFKSAVVGLEKIVISSLLPSFDVYTFNFFGNNYPMSVRDYIVTPVATYLSTKHFVDKVDIKGAIFNATTATDNTAICHDLSTEYFINQAVLKNNMFCSVIISDYSSIYNNSDSSAEHNAVCYSIDENEYNNQ